MKALSIWQPWASLIICGMKKVETRSWPAPNDVRGHRIAIASTKTIRREQRNAADEPDFQRQYRASGLPPINDLPLGYILGTVMVVGCREMDSQLIQDLDAQEEALGVYGPGRFAWFLSDPEPLGKPIPVRGGQGLWNWSSS